MPLDVEVLGAPGRDNALLVRVESGSRLDRLLFDCGGGCVSALVRSEVQKIDHLFFSHLHMDHVAGFDDFFRVNYSRESRDNHVWGPSGTASILQHRFRGFWWNLHEGYSVSWNVHEFDGGGLESSRFELSEAFELAHPATSPGAEREQGGVILITPAYEIGAIELEHNGPSLGYLVRESDRVNVRTDRLEDSGLRPGPWLEVVRDLEIERETVEVDGRILALAELRSDLLVSSRGDSVAYLTDFTLEERSFERVADWLHGCDTLVCEAQYRHADVELARRNAHMTTTGVARLASAAEVSDLVLIHLSDRYDERERLEMLEEARAIFPRASFPGSWALE